MKVWAHFEYWNFFDNIALLLLKVSKTTHNFLVCHIFPWMKSAEVLKYRINYLTEINSIDVLFFSDCHYGSILIFTSTHFPVFTQFSTHIKMKVVWAIVFNHLLGRSAARQVRILRWKDGNNSSFYRRRRTMFDKLYCSGLLALHQSFYQKRCNINI